MHRIHHRRALEAGFIDDIKSDIRNSKAVRNLKSNIKSKLTNAKNKAKDIKDTVTGNKEYYYEFKAQGRMTFWFADEEISVHQDGEYYDVYLPDLGYRNQDTNSYFASEAEDNGLIDEIQYDLAEQDDLAQYIDSPLANKIKSVKFDRFFKTDGEFFGYVYSVVASRKLTEQDKAEFIDYMTGQMADGFGEGYEQGAFDSTIYIDDCATVDNPNYNEYEAYDEEGYPIEDYEEPETIDVNINEEVAVNVYVHLWNSKCWNPSEYHGMAPTIEEVKQ